MQHNYGHVLFVCGPDEGNPITQKALSKIETF